MFKCLARDAAAIGVCLFGLAAQAWAGPLDAATAGGVSAAQTLGSGGGPPAGAIGVTPLPAPPVSLGSAPAAAPAAAAPPRAAAPAVAAEPARR